MRFSRSIIFGLFFTSLNFQDHGEKTLSPLAVAALEKTAEFLTIGCYSEMTIRNYTGELRYFFCYYPDVAPPSFDQQMVMHYLLMHHQNAWMRAQQVPYGRSKHLLLLSPCAAKALCYSDGKT